MENLREQIFQVTNDFLTSIQNLTQQHTALVLQETFSSLGSRAQRPAAVAPTARAVPASANRPRGAKRDSQELEQLSERFLQFVRANPGLRIEQINKQLGTTTTELALPIRKLISSKEITTKGQKRSTTYFGKGSNGKSSPAVALASDGNGNGTDKTASKPARAKKKSKAKAKSKK